MPGTPYKIKSIVTQKLGGVNYFHYYLCRQLKGCGMEINVNKYKRKNIADILSISTETIRYFEDIGVVSPQIDPQNHYRYFSDMDILRIFMYRYYRSFGLSQEQVMLLNCSSDINGILSGFDILEDHIFNEIDRLQKMIRYITLIRTWINKIPTLEKYL